ncbi:hypothetical protein [Burkholderia ambifaria]|uniref:hypothetical protein n=1 Tax=Burkholderia ambifaria TaxID=152480 RepID=UPI00158B64D3|nr:hypothetical protein [Burkholderia ambifaria]
MHTFWTIVAGVLLLAVFLLFGQLWGTDVSALGYAAKVFIPAWLVLSLANLWVGVQQGGYSVREELPILVVVFGIPAAVAMLAVFLFPRG